VSKRSLQRKNRSLLRGTGLHTKGEKGVLTEEGVKSGKSKEKKVGTPGGGQGISVVVDRIGIAESKKKRVSHFHNRAA